MISAVIRAGDNLEALAVTLAGLVPGVAEGVLRDAVIVDCGEVSEVQELAEAAGAAYVALKAGDVSGGGIWQAGARLVKGPWFLLLAAGDVPGLNWVPVMDRFVRGANGNAAAPDIAVFPVGGRGGLRGLARGLKTRVTRRPALVAGMVVPGSVIQRGDGGGARLRRLSVELERHGEP